MFWHDIAELKEMMIAFKHSLLRVEQSLEEIRCKQAGDDDIFSSFSQRLDEFYEICVDRKTVEKFDDYMQNVDKLNGMINEFKGCVTLARGALEERRELDKQTEETNKLAYHSQEIYKSMLSFIKAGENIKHEAHFKIDAIYRALCENEEKKTPKKKKTVKKKTSIPAVDSNTSN